MKMNTLLSTATIRTTRAVDVDTICERYTGNDTGAEPPSVSVLRGP
jgi:hypothetical protein